MEIVSVTEENQQIYLNLAQSYEGEFSSITRKIPNRHGLFELDVHIGSLTKGYVLFVENVPAGIAAICQGDNEYYEVCEFYVVPSFRKKLWGMKFAHAIWRNCPGKWVIKQIAGAEYASEFWRKTIGSFNQTTYTEDKYDDPYWGVVTRQTFGVKHND